MKTVGIFVVGALLAASLASAQQANLRTELEVARSVLAAERQAVLGANVPLKAEEAKAFWPVYNAYRAEMQAQGDRLLQLLGKVAQSDKKLDAAEAKAFVDGYLDVVAKRLEIRRAFIGKIRPLLPAHSVALVLVYEEKMDAMVLDAAFEILRILKADAPA